MFVAGAAGTEFDLINEAIRFPGSCCQHRDLARQCRTSAAHPQAQGICNVVVAGDGTERVPGSRAPYGRTPAAPGTARWVPCGSVYCAPGWVRQHTTRCGQRREPLAPRTVGTRPLSRGSPPCKALCMRARFRHRNAVDDPGHWAKPLALAGRACCCPARPVVTVVMPPTAARRHPVDLLLCGHHYRVCRAALTAAGATVYDETGALINTGGGGHEPARPEPADAAPRR